jgi:hypothetical protein
LERESRKDEGAMMRAEEMAVIVAVGVFNMLNGPSDISTMLFRDSLPRLVRVLTIIAPLCYREATPMFCNADIAFRPTFEDRVVLAET